MSSEYCELDEDGGRLAIGSDDIDCEIPTQYTSQRKPFVSATWRCLEADSYDVVDEVRQELPKDGGGELQVHSHWSEQVEDKGHRTERVAEEPLFVVAGALLTHNQLMPNEGMDGRREKIAAGVCGFSGQERIRVG